MSRAVLFLPTWQWFVPRTSLYKPWQTLRGGTLPETDSSHLKMDSWNTSFLLGWPIFRCYVSFRECNHPYRFSGSVVGFFSEAYPPLPQRSISLRGDANRTKSQVVNMCLFGGVVLHEFSSQNIYIIYSIQSIIPPQQPIQLSNSSLNNKNQAGNDGLVSQVVLSS